MATSWNVEQKPVAVPLPLLSSSALTVLVDSHMRAFSMLYDEQQARREAAKARLRAELAALDVFVAEPCRQDYVPSGEPPLW